MSQGVLGVTYYPSCVVNLRLRFDDAFTSGYTNVKSDPPTTSVDDAVKNPPSTPAGSTGTLALFTKPQDTLSHVVARIPKTCSVEIPAYRQAGKFSMTLDYRDLPVDPRLVRAAGVEIYMDSVPADQFAESIPTVNPAAGQRGSVLGKQGRLSMLKGSAENLLLQGIVDSWHVSHTSKGSEITMEGRDLTGIFLNTPITAEVVAEIKLNRRIDDVIRDVTALMAGQAAGLQVIASPDDEWGANGVPYIGEAITKQVTAPEVRKNQKPGQQVGRSRFSIGGEPDKMNFWDIITRWCYYVGAVPTFTVLPDAQYDKNARAGGYDADGVPFKPTLLIRPANSLYDQVQAGDEYPKRTPFKDNQKRNIEGKNITVRRMLYGRNVDELTFERKFVGKSIPRVIELVSYDTSSKQRGAGKLISVLWPPAAVALAEEYANVLTTNAAKADRSIEAPNGYIANKDKTRISVPGITDEDLLKKLAEQIYNEICRGELGGSVRTKSLASFGAGNEDPDLVRLRPGDGVQLAIDTRPLTSYAPNSSYLATMRQQNPEEMAAELNKRLDDWNLSRAIAYTATDEVFQLLNIYRVSNVKFDWAISSGISLAFDFHNFVVPRNDLSARPPAVRQTASTGRGAAVPKPIAASTDRARTR